MMPDWCTPLQPRNERKPNSPQKTKRIHRKRAHRTQRNYPSFADNKNQKKFTAKEHIERKEKRKESFFRAPCVLSRILKKSKRNEFTAKERIERKEKRKEKRIFLSRSLRSFADNKKE